MRVSPHPAQAFTNAPRGTRSCPPPIPHCEPVGDSWDPNTMGSTEIEIPPAPSPKRGGGEYKTPSPRPPPRSGEGEEEPLWIRYSNTSVPNFWNSWKLGPTRAQSQLVCSCRRSPCGRNWPAISCPPSAAHSAAARAVRRAGTPPPSSPSPPRRTSVRRRWPTSPCASCRRRLRTTAASRGTCRPSSAPGSAAPCSAARFRTRNRSCRARRARGRLRRRPRSTGAESPA